MLVSFFGHRSTQKTAAKSSHKPAKETWQEADQLELELGRDAAIRFIRDQIARSDRGHRRRLYVLHDELARRYDPARRAG